MSSQWFSKRAVFYHITLAIVFPGFFALAYWQLHRALSGNTLSWAYVFEWPFFAGYAVYLWWHLIHDQNKNLEVKQANVIHDVDDEDDLELKKYNQYLASLHEKDSDNKRAAK
jgi:DNA-binding transcriptional regulator of glucitol operon